MLEFGFFVKFDLKRDMIHKYWLNRRSNIYIRNIKGIILLPSTNLFLKYFYRFFITSAPIDDIVPGTGSVPGALEITWKIDEG